MVSFNGISLESIDSAIKILDVTVGAPQVQNTTIEPALADGDIFARARFLSRKVLVTFLVMEDDMQRRALVLSRITAWANTRSPQKLRVPQEERGYLTAVCSSFPDDSARDYWTELHVEFTCNSPYYQANEESSVDLGDSHVVTVVHADAPAWRIEQTVSNALAYPMWALGSKFVQFVAVGTGKLVITRSDQTAMLGENSALPALMLGSRFFDLAAGLNQIDTENGAGGVIYWRERWL